MISRMTSVAFTVSALCLALNGCSSVTGGNQQTISVEALTDKGSLIGANCELSNDKGKWFVTTPGSTTLNRSNEELIVICNKEGVEPGIANVESTTQAGMAGNVLMGVLIPIVGIVAAAIDHSSGSPYAYPTLLQVMMGKTLKISQYTIDQSKKDSAQAVDTNTAKPVQPNVERFTLTSEGVQPEPTTATNSKTSGPHSSLDQATTQCLKLGLKSDSNEFQMCLNKLMN